MATVVPISSAGNRRSNPKAEPSSTHTLDPATLTAKQLRDDFRTLNFEVALNRDALGDHMATRCTEIPPEVAQACFLVGEQQMSARKRAAFFEMMVAHPDLYIEGPGVEVFTWVVLALGRNPRDPAFVRLLQPSTQELVVPHLERIEAFTAPSEVDGPAA